MSSFLPPLPSPPNPPSPTIAPPPSPSIQSSPSFVLIHSASVSQVPVAKSSRNAPARVSKSKNDLTKEEGEGGEGGVSSYGNEDVSTPKNRRTIDEHKTARVTRFSRCCSLTLVCFLSSLHPSLRSAEMERSWGGEGGEKLYDNTLSSLRTRRRRLFLRLEVNPPPCTTSMCSSWCIYVWFAGSLFMLQ